MNISGLMRIYKSEFDGRATYQTTISKKDQHDNYENMYISVQLPKDTELENNSKIDVKKGFLSFYKTKQGIPKVKAVVQEFEKETQEQPQESTPNYFDDPQGYYGNDLPF